MKPKIFNQQEVRAILDGRKIQFREVVKGLPQNGNFAPAHYSQMTTQKKVCFVNLDLANPYNETQDILLPFNVGDVIYVRETWNNGLGGDYCYKSDTDNPIYLDENWTWKSPATMPREASRIFLEVTGVRVERLQSISEDDADAEGIEYSEICNGDDYSYYPRNYELNMKTADGWPYFKEGQEVDSFQSLWQATKGKKHPWVSNPWVWKIEFKMIEKP